MCTRNTEIQKEINLETIETKVKNKKTNKQIYMYVLHVITFLLLPRSGSLCLMLMTLSIFSDTCQKKKDPNLASPSDARMYLKSRKRKPGRNYKSTADVVQKRIVSLSYREV